MSRLRLSRRSSAFALLAALVAAPPRVAHATIQPGQAVLPAAAGSSDERAATIVAPAGSSAPGTPAPAPRAKLSYRRSSTPQLDGKLVGLDGVQLDLYPLSRRYVRLGVELEGGAGRSASSSSSTWYGLVGLSAGFQYPWRVTPFVEGRFAAGLLGGAYSGTLATVGGVQLTAQNVPAATVIYVGGVEAGAELYTVGRLYLSVAIGWARPTVLLPDFARMAASPSSGMQLKSQSEDTLTFKVGVGL